MRAFFNTMAASAMVVALISGCTKKRDYKEVYKENVFTKGLIDESALYLYGPSHNQSSRHADATRPQWEGDTKLVRLALTETSIKVVEVEQDSRFAGTAVNNRPVLEIPITHHEYRCKETAYGECTREEEENKDLPWNQKKFFKPDFSKVQVHEVNAMPLDFENLFFNCFSETGAQLDRYAIEPDAINFTIEKTFKTSGICLGNIESLSDISFFSQLQFSIVKLSALASENYQPVVYPDSDEGTFGFFTTEQNKLAIDNRDEEAGHKVLMNRWNPEKKKVVYYLSDEFALPEFSKVRQATEQAVASVNQGLREAGASLQIELKDAQGRSAGDLRNSMIVLVKDPTAAGIIGYGPSQANPLTGELVHARVVMYYGTILKFIRSTYEEILAESAARSSKSSGSGEAQTTSGTGGTSRSADLLRSNLGLTAHQTAHQTKSPKTSSPVQNLPTAFEKSGSGKLAGGELSRLELDRVMGDLKKLEKEKSAVFEKITDEDELADQRIAVLSRHNAYPAELVDFGPGVSKAVRDLFGSGKLKPWTELTDSEKQKIIDIAFPSVWISTLVHEIGHTLGLRHNFAGSEDKANYYNAEELKAMGLEGHEIPYSSVMDYAGRTLNELHTMGKYDIAALRFGYTRKVETKEGKFVSLGDSPSLASFITQNKSKPQAEKVELKEFDFCTDEHVSVNPNCNRFDEGTNLSEIADYYFKNYERDYKRRNFRNGARNFSRFDDLSYRARLKSTFDELRLVFERVDRISKKFGIPLKHSIWESNVFLKDLKQAATKINLFFQYILKTPNPHCLVSYDGPKGTEYEAIPRESDSFSCLDGELEADLKQRFPQISNLKVVAEAGKSFESLKDPKSTNHYMDQIDVRGIWVDKLLALQTLLKRRMGILTFDDVMGNFLDYPEFRDSLMGTLENLVLDEAEGALVFTLPSGEPMVLGVPLDLNDTHQIVEPLAKGLLKSFDLPLGIVSFQKKIVDYVMATAHDPQNPDATRLLVSHFAVHRFAPNGVEDLTHITIAGQGYWARPENGLARELIRFIDVVQVLSQIDKERIKAILAMLEQVPPDTVGMPPENLSDLEKRAYKFTIDEIKSFLEDDNGARKKMLAKAKILTYLGNAN